MLDIAHDHKDENYSCNLLMNCPFVGSELLVKIRVGSKHHILQKVKNDRIRKEKVDLLKHKFGEDLPLHEKDEVIEKILEYSSVNEALDEFINLMNKGDLGKTTTAKTMTDFIAGLNGGDQDSAKIALEKLQESLDDVEEYHAIQNRQRLKIFLRRRKHLSPDVLETMAKDKEVTDILNIMVGNSCNQDGVKALERLIDVYKKAKKNQGTKKSTCSIL